MSDADDVPEVGSLIAGKYRVKRALAAGGMGSLLEAEHPLLDKTVAIKLVKRAGEQAHRRLIREAQTAQALSSEHVVRVFDVGFHDDAPYIVMEKLEGRDLASLVDEAPLGICDAVDSILEACVAVAEAHAVGIIHRDIKPSNLFLTRTASQKRFVKVLDFGISKQLELEDVPADPSSTAPGQMLGSPYYMSPEQLRNATKVDARTDVWSLGVTLFNLLTGEHPFEGDTVSEVSAAIFTDPPRDIRRLRQNLPPELCDVIQRTLEKRADDRVPSVAALAASLVPFASKRGRLAAERIEQLGIQVPPEPDVVRPAVRATDTTATDAGLAATLPGSVSEESPANVDATRGTTTAAPQRQIPVAAFALLAAIVGLAGYWWIQRESSPATSASAMVSALPAVPAPKSAGQASAPRPSASVPTDPVASAPTAKSSPARTSPRISPSMKSAPPPASAARTEPKPRVDIDGVPIVE